jgi:hypothetical protein
MADYAFVPGGTSFELAAKDYLEFRTGGGWLPINVDTGLPLATFKEFIAEVEKAHVTILPVDDLWVASHGLWTGAMTVPLMGTLTGETFEAVSSAAALSGLAVPSGIRDPRKVKNGLPIPCVVHFVGCFVGRYDPYMRRLKLGMGEGALGVEAPVMFDVFFAHSDGSQVLKGALRYMLYDFRVAVRDPVATRQDLLAAFSAQKNPRIDGGVISDAVYDKAVPTDFSKLGKVKQPMNAALNPAVEGRASLQVQNVYDYEIQGAGSFLMPKGPFDSKDRNVIEAFIEDQLRLRSEFQDAYPFPYFLRYDFKDLSSFVKGFTWKPASTTPDASGRIIWFGFRHFYHVGVPIVNPSNDKQELLYDYVSADGTVQQLALSNTPSCFARVFTDEP